MFAARGQRGLGRRRPRTTSISQPRVARRGEARRDAVVSSQRCYRASTIAKRQGERRPGQSGDPAAPERMRGVSRPNKHNRQTPGVSETDDAIARSRSDAHAHDGWNRPRLDRRGRDGPGRGSGAAEGGETRLASSFGVGISAFRLANAEGQRGKGGGPQVAPSTTSSRSACGRH